MADLVCEVEQEEDGGYSAECLTEDIATQIHLGRDARQRARRGRGLLLRQHDSRDHSLASCMRRSFVRRVGIVSANESPSFGLPLPRHCPESLPPVDFSLIAPPAQPMYPAWRFSADSRAWL